MTKELKDLIAIARLIRDRDLAELAQKQSKRTEMSHARDQVLSRIDKEAVQSQSDLAYQRMCRDLRAGWLRDQAKALTVEEARSAALAERSRLIAAKSFGRAQVLFQILTSMEE